MAKKLKHYRGRDIYSSKRPKNWLKILLWILALVVLFYAGYYLGDKLFNWRQGPLDEPSSSVSEANDQSKMDDSSSADASDAPSEPSSETAGTSEIKAAGWLDASVLSDRAKLDAALKVCKEKGQNAAVFVLKDDSGMVLYQSALENVAKANAIAANPADLSVIRSVFEENQMIPIAVVNTFKDPKGAKLSGTAIWYQNKEDYLWLDNYAEKGGKPWLNPYLAKARGYLTDIVGEISAAGLPYVMLDNVRFGSRMNDSMAGMGPDSSMPRIEVLKTFMNECKETAAKNNAKVLLSANVSDILQESTAYLDGNILSIEPAMIAPVFSLQSLNGTQTVNGQTFENPGQAPAEFTKAVLNAVQAKLPNVTIMPILTDYTSVRQQQITAFGENTAYIVKASD